MLKRICSRCGNEVVESEVEGYQYQCVECDEDLYTFETELIDVEEE
jgi:DNA-directed RNA polymerase subunit RPC12/RpoP